MKAAVCSQSVNDREELHFKAALWSEHRTRHQHVLLFLMTPPDPEPTTNMRFNQKPSWMLLSFPQLGNTNTAFILVPVTAGHLENASIGLRSAKPQGQAAGSNTDRQKTVEKTTNREVIQNRNSHTPYSEQDGRYEAPSVKKCKKKKKSLEH